MVDDGRTEADLIARARAGEHEAYAELVRRYQDVAVATAFLVLGDRGDAEDAAQEAFTKAFVALRRFRPDGSFRAWLLRIVANEAYTIRGAAQRRAELVSRASSASIPGMTPAGSAEAAAMAEQRREALLQALFDLPEADRLVLTYRYFFDLSEAEMAEVLGVARGTIKSRLSRAIARLRPILRDIGPLVVAGPVLDKALQEAFAQLGQTAAGQPAPHLSQAVLQQLGGVPAPLGASRLRTAGQHLVSNIGVAAGVVGAMVLVAVGARTVLMDRQSPPPPPRTTLVYGGDLTDTDRQELARMLGVADAPADSVPRDELVAELRSRDLPVAPSDEAISSAAMTCGTPSEGLEVRTLHITRIPAAAYVTALLLSGLQGASVTIAAPADKPVTGEAALVGTLKAARTCLGKEPEEQRARLAYQQIKVLDALAEDPSDLTNPSAMVLHALQAMLEGTPAPSDPPELVSFLEQIRGLEYGAYARGFVVEELSSDHVKLTARQ